jgi:hypothetical protein
MPIWKGVKLIIARTRLKHTLCLQKNGKCRRYLENRFSSCASLYVCEYAVTCTGSSRLDGHTAHDGHVRQCMRARARAQVPHARRAVVAGRHESVNNLGAPIIKSPTCIRARPRTTAGLCVLVVQSHVPCKGVGYIR